MTQSAFTAFINRIWTALDGEPAALAVIAETGEAALPSVFAVTDLATAATGAAALAAANLIALRHGERPDVQVDRRLSSLWFQGTLRPRGWTLPPPWDPVAGDYRAADGWIRLHTNALHHREAALAVLGVPAEKTAVARAVALWSKTELESAIVANRGCAAAMHASDEWARHPQGGAVAAEPLISWVPGSSAPLPDWITSRMRPLQGIRVLDLTRVLAGPVATRFLAGLGAEILRIDPPDWDEPGVLPTVMLGKRAARLDLRSAEGRSTLTRLLSQADVLVHGYRPGALAGLGLDTEQRQTLRPGLIDVSLDAYGWTGPWRQRRGFDSLVQMSSGIAEAGMRRLGKDRPHPLPVQALDHACGHLIAAAVLTAIARRLETGQGWIARTSLARTATLLMAGPPGDPHATPAPETDDDFSPEIELTSWGPALRVRPPVLIAGTPLRWDRPATALGTSAPVWLDQ
jgi:crotonobetainyl-CoA:carnitine CoA-transferase CaiB-like acyl-CoA transferase